MQSPSFAVLETSGHGKAREIVSRQIIAVSQQWGKVGSRFAGINDANQCTIPPGRIPKWQPILHSQRRRLWSSARGKNRTRFPSIGPLPHGPSPTLRSANSMFIAIAVFAIIASLLIQLLVSGPRQFRKRAKFLSEYTARKGVPLGELLHRPDDGQFFRAGHSDKSIFEVLCQRVGWYYRYRGP